MIGWMGSRGVVVAFLVVLLTTLTPLLLPIVVKSRRRGQRPRTATLKILHSPANAKFEIVAVHGLGADPNHTWTRAVPADSADRHQENGAAEFVGGHCPKRIHLLEDLLPEEFPEARILSFEHNSNWLIDAPVKTTEEIGKNLLEEIKAKRFHPHLPIIFIGHSLGGIIIKQALCGQDFQDIVDDISGIIFLGTPHHGSSISAAAAVLAFVTGFLGSDTTLLLSLRSHGAQLSNLAGTFRSRIAPNEHRRQKVRVISFYETMPMYLLGWLSIGSVVSRDSAVVHADEEYGIDTNHSGLNKCGTLDDGLFMKLKQAISSLRAPSLLEQADSFIRNEHYNADKLKIERLSGILLPMDDCYINLAIVEQPCQDAGRLIERDPRSSAFSLLARQKVETPDKEVQVELATIFTERKQPKRGPIYPRRILIRGRAGVGKSTLCKKIVHEFCRGTWSDWTKIFDRVLWVPLRNLKLDGRRNLAEYNFECLFRHEYFSQPHNRPDLAKELSNALATEGINSKTLFLLDGLDEVYYDLSGDGAMPKFLRLLLDQTNVIITTRPNASLQALRPLDLELETIGFYPGQVEDYIEKTFTDPKKTEIDQKTVDEIRSFLRDHWLLQALVRIPIQLDAFCYTWEGFDHGFMPDTVTGIYRAIEQRLWEKDVVRLGRVKEGYARSAQEVEIESEVKSETALLECLAFNGLQCDIIDFTPTHRNEIAKRSPLPPGLSLAPGLSRDETLGRLSFLRTSDPSAKAKDQNYHFIHLTFQEYFAARHFARQWTSKQTLDCVGLNSTRREQIPPVEFLRKHKYTARYDVFWRFVAGLLDTAEQASFFDLIEKEPLDLLGPTHQRLVMHCLSEVSNDLPIRRNLEARLSQWLLFELDLTGSSLLARDSECPEASILTILETESGSLRNGVLYALRHRDAQLSEAAMVALTTLLQHEEWDVRSAAAEALSRQSPLSEAAMTALIVLLQDKEWHARYAAAEALGRQSPLSEAAMAALIVLLQHEESGVRSAAAEALSRQSHLSEAAMAALIVLLQHEESCVRSAAAEALGGQSPLSEAAMAALIVLLQDEESHVRYAAAEALGGQSPLSEAAMTALIVLLQDKEWHARYAAAEALGRQSSLSEAAMAALIALLQDEESHVRSAAAAALGGQSHLSEAAMTALIVLLQDKKWHARSAAAEALSRQSPLSEAAMTALIALLQDEESHVRYAAAAALGGQSPLSEAAMAALTALLQDKEWPIRSAAAAALGGQSNLSDNILEVMGLLPEFELPTRFLGNTFRYSQFLKPWYGSLLSRSFREQLSLYVDGGSSCIINQPSGLRTASFEGGSVDDRFRSSLDDGRQHWNIHGHNNLWDKCSG